MSLGKRIVFIGAGNMTEALVDGLLTSGLTTPADLHTTDLLEARRTHMASRFGVGVGQVNTEAAAIGDVVVLAVEPQDLDGVLLDIAPAIRPTSLVISVAAGYPLARVRRHVKSDVALVRAMPNTPTSIQAGVTGLAFDPAVSPDFRATATRIFEAVGRVVIVDERLMDAVTGLSGSGPAYVYVLIEALADGAVRMGLGRQTAHLLAAQTVYGAAQMALRTGEHPAQLKDRITSPGGTTMAGLDVMEAGRIRGVVMSAIEAAAKRARDLSLGSDPR